MPDYPIPHPSLCLIPLAPRGKVPLVHGWPTLDRDDPIFAQIFEATPGANVGVRLDDLLVVDCDSAEGVKWWLEDGRAASVETSGNPERRTFWYSRQADRPLGDAGTFRIRPDVEVRWGPKFQQLIPPSIHPCGEPYRWLQGGMSDISGPLTPAPESVLAEQRPRASVSGPGGPGWDVVERGGREDFLVALAGLMRARGAGERALGDALASVNQALCVPPVPATAIARIARSVSRYEADETLTYVIEVSDGKGFQSNSARPTTSTPRYRLVVGPLDHQVSPDPG